MFNISQVMLKLQGGMFNMTGEQGRFNLPITLDVSNRAIRISNRANRITSDSNRCDSEAPPKSGILESFFGYYFLGPFWTHMHT